MRCERSTCVLFFTWGKKKKKTPARCYFNKLMQSHLICVRAHTHTPLSVPLVQRYQCMSKHSIYTWRPFCHTPLCPPPRWSLFLRLALSSLTGLQQIRRLTPFWVTHLAFFLSLCHLWTPLDIPFEGGVCVLGDGGVWRDKEMKWRSLVAANDLLKRGR